MQKIYSIQVLRGIAAAFVCYFHAVENVIHRESTYKMSQDVFSLSASFYSYFSIGVDIFFVISGFIMTYTTWNAFQKEKAVTVFLKKRFIRIFPVFWVFLFANQVFLLLHYQFGTGEPVLWYKFFYSIFLLPWGTSGFTGYALPQAWTLTYELYFYLIFAFTLFFKRSYSLLIVIIIFSLGVLFKPEFLALKFPVLSIISNDLLFEFVFGMLIGVSYRKGIKPGGKLLLLGLLVLIFWVAFKDILLQYKFFELRFIYCGIPAALLIWLCVNFERWKTIEFPSFLLRLGDISYTLYLAHNIIILILFRLIFIDTGLYHYIPMDVSVIICTILCILCANFLYLIMEKPLINFLHRGKFLFLSKQVQ